MVEYTDYIKWKLIEVWTNHVYIPDGVMVNEWIIIGCIGPSLLE